MTNETYALLERYMQSCMGDAAHDCERVYRVLYLASDVSGAMGIARTLQYGGRTGEPLYTIGPNGAVLDGEEDAPSFFHEYQFKRKRVASGFHTARAVQPARARQKTAAAFYESLRQEVYAAYGGREELTRRLDG